jgi:hypothetical protein
MSDYFGLPAEYLIQRERDIFAEQTPMIISDLIEISAVHDKVLFDGIMDLSHIAPLISNNRIIYFYVSRYIRERDFFNRADHIHILENIKNNPNLSDGEKEKRILLRKTVAIDSYDYDAKKFRITQFDRDDSTTIEEMLGFTERHFGLI